MSRFWSAVVHGLTPYVPGEQPKLDNLVKLNTNEHPCGPSPKVLEAIRAATGDGLRLYPDPNADALKAALARHHGVRPEQIFVGNGSDEVLAHAFMALLKHERALWFPDITYSFYPVYCGLYDIQPRIVPLAEDFSIRVEDYLPRGDERAGAIIFPNPNAPTGRLLALAEVERIVAANPEAVVLVEAEIWPNFLWRARDLGKPVFLVNARLSEKSHRGYKKWSFLFGPLFRSFAGVGCQNEADAKRLEEIGCRKERIHVVGNLKFDAATVTEKRLLDVPRLLAQLGVASDAQLIVAGSTHAGEEKILGEVFLRLRARFPNLFLIVVPRHHERGRDGHEIPVLAVGVTDVRPEHEAQLLRRLDDPLRHLS